MVWEISALQNGSLCYQYLSIYQYQSQNRKGCKADPLLKSQGSRHSRLYIIVVVSLHVDEQLYQAIWLLYYWIGCSESAANPLNDGPKLRYLAKNVKSPGSLFISSMRRVAWYQTFYILREKWHPPFLVLSCY